MPSGIAWWEILLVALLVLLVFGPQRLPEIGRSLGHGIREFRGSITGKNGDADTAGKAALAQAAQDAAPERLRLRLADVERDHLPVAGLVQPRRRAPGTCARPGRRL
jgi:sec-independent protein translocase protein TatA